MKGQEDLATESQRFISSIMVHSSLSPKPYEILCSSAPGIIKVSEAGMKGFGEAHLYEDFHELAENPCVPAGENVLAP
jgi:hypothetical protein